MASSRNTLQRARQIPCCLVLAGPNLASHGIFFKDLLEGLRTDCDGSILVSVTSNESPNLKTILKNIASAVTAGQYQRQPDSSIDEEYVSSMKSKDRKLLNYDLQILHDWFRDRRKLGKVVVALEDSEAFDNSLIGEIVEIFRCVG